LGRKRSGELMVVPDAASFTHHHDHSASIGNPAVFAQVRSFQPLRALVSFSVFAGAIALAALGFAPIAATAFAGAVLLIVLGVIGADEAYGGLRPEILMLIAGMVIIGLAMEQTGLAGAATGALVGSVGGLGPLFALVAFYGAALLITELLSNATVAVLLTPVAVALAESLGVSSKPFIAALMIAASAAFATPFGYLDFVRVGLPLDLVTWIAGAAAIPIFFPF
jgi:di/tricarboxylate transporter